MYNNKIVLRKRGFESFQGWKLWTQVLFGIIISLIVGYIYLGTKFADFSQSSSLYPVISVVYILFLLFHTAYTNKAKIEVDAFGLAYHSGYPELLQRFDKDWFIPWSEIESIEREKKSLIRQPMIFPLVIKLYNKKFTVNPSLWIDEKQGTPKVSFLGTANNFIEIYETSPLVKLFDDKGLLDVNKSLRHLHHSKWTADVAGTDIASSKVGIFLVTVFAFSSLYYFIDTFLLMPESYADKVPYEYIIGVGIVAFIASFLLLTKSKFVMLERIVLSLLVSISMALLTYPMLLRMNKWTDTDGLHDYKYTAIHYTKWKAENSALPNLTFNSRNWQYWKQFEQGAEKTFRLRKGGLGFYQVDMEPILEDQRSHYRSQ